ncbi:YdcF family protein [Pollutimonas sp. H1-120]|uniref:YdcF family protein n=1 Tax=Pollutimonas sp. H1-120 TaxID=3148824 RepID=UPI003B51E600
MTSTLNGTISQVILLPTSILALLVLGCLLLWRCYRRSGLVLILVSAGVLAILSMPFTALHLIHTLQVYPAVHPADMAKAQAIVVLGGGISHDQPEYAADVSNNATLERLRYTAFLYNQHELPILVTGGTPSGGEAEGWVMKRELESLFNVPVRWLEVESDNTAQNAAFSRKILQAYGVDTIALVTHAWHMPRAKQIFEKAGFNIIPAPTGFYTKGFKGIMNFIPQAEYLNLSNIAIREWIGMGWYRLRDNP